MYIVFHVIESCFLFSLDSQQLLLKAWFQIPRTWLENKANKFWIWLQKRKGGRIIENHFNAIWERGVGTWTRKQLFVIPNRVPNIKNRYICSFKSRLRHTVAINCGTIHSWLKWTENVCNQNTKLVHKNIGRGIFWRRTPFKLETLSFERCCLCCKRPPAYL